MKDKNRQLQQMFVRATDEVVPAAPWLETQVVEALRVRGSARLRVIDRGAFGGMGSGLRVAAALVVLLIAVGTVGALLMSARLLHNPTLPGGRSTTHQGPTPSIATFTPSPAVRASNWPPGATVPASLAGSWQPVSYRAVLHMAEYSWELGDDSVSTMNLCGPGPCYTGNVVVNGSEIDFIDNVCTLKAGFGYERFTYTLTGNTLVLTLMPGSGQSNCVWHLAGTYSRVLTS